VGGFGLDWIGLGWVFFLGGFGWGAGKVGGGGNWFITEHVAYLRATRLWKLIESRWGN